VVDSSGLENRYSSEQRTIEGSNPSLSFCSLNRFSYLLILYGPVGKARLGKIAEPEKKTRSDIKMS
jgi:hypothetical protein